MTDYWKSNERKYCDFCKCWLSDNKASIAFHENGKRHKQNVAKRITNISREAEKAEKERKQMDLDIRKMEDAALRAYANDIHCQRDLTAHSVKAALSNITSSPEVSRSIDNKAAIRGVRQVDPVALPENWDISENKSNYPTTTNPQYQVPDSSLWVEGKTDDGHTYYWNVKTNESVWDKPKEGYLSWTEFQRINDIAIKQEEIRQAEEAKQFRENANEEVARYNRERLKVIRQQSKITATTDTKPDSEPAYKTEEEAKAPEIGEWQTVDIKPPIVHHIDLQLPKVSDKYVAPIVTKNVVDTEPPVKRFKEKLITSLDEEIINTTSASFKKSKFAARKNMRQRTNDD